MAEHAIGSYWRRWDLQVHSPASHVQRYGSGEAAWERYLSDLESLAPDIVVLAINDYLTIEGYKRVVDAREKGRLQNIETVFPCVELRLARLAGADKLTRINYHVLFSDRLDIRTIESQFMNQLSGRAQLTPEAQALDVDWKGFITEETLEELGRAIKTSTPSPAREGLTETDYVLGANNINFEPGALNELLETGSGISGNYVTAVGRSEWEEMRWNDHSIAEKKTIINSVACVFTAAQDAASFERAREHLLREGVNGVLLDCSDAHDFSDSGDKDRIGNCLLWVKANPSFSGLLAALHDYDSRVHVGLEPPVFERMRRRPRCFMQAVRFERTAQSGSDERWFEDQELELNPELVAIIGNRGMGKSALLDCIAFAARSEYPVEKTSFLSKFRRSNDGKAADYVIRLSWQGGDPSVACLADDQDRNAAPLATHLPQDFIDQLCNELGDEFAKELERAVFSHVREDERLGVGSLGELIELRSHATGVALEGLRVQLHDVDVAVADLEREARPERAQELEHRLEELRQQVRGLWQNRVSYPSLPDAGDDHGDALEALKAEYREGSAELSRQKARRTVVRSLIEAAKRVESQVVLAEQRMQEVERSSADDLEALGLRWEDLLSVTTDLSSLTDLTQSLTTEKEALDQLLDPEDDDSLVRRVGELKTSLSQATEAMSKPKQQFEADIRAHKELRDELRRIIGARGDPDSIRGVQAGLGFVATELDSELGRLSAKRVEITRQVFEQLRQRVKIYEDLYGPVQAFVDAYESQADLAVLFEARLEEEALEESVLSHILHNKKGSYHGTKEGRDRLSRLVAGCDFDSWDSVSTLLDRFLNSLQFDLREGFSGERRYVHDQLRDGDPTALYDYVYGLEFLRPRYRITLNGKPLSDLSPGEKGALLLVFYLLVDMSDAPLLIDQPEENLDNQTVFAVLRPFIREARARRQVILVTHNPNIAVAAGADQVIYCEIDKRAGSKVSYECGALEDPRIRRRIVDVLEGTMPAFETRRDRYTLTGADTSL